MKKELKEFYKREWRDADYILSLTQEGLLWQIWKERSNKLFYFLMGVVVPMAMIALFIIT